MNLENMTEVRSTRHKGPVYGSSDMCAVFRPNHSTDKRESNVAEGLKGEASSGRGGEKGGE